MTDSTTDNPAKHWRRELLDLKERVKQHSLGVEQALAIAQKMKDDYGDNYVKPNSDIINAHIQLCSTLEQADMVIRRYRADSAPLTTTTFNILISLSPDLATAYSYFNRIFDGGLEPNIYTLNGLISKCSSFEQGRNILKTLNKYNILPNTQTFNTLLSLTITGEQRMEILETMERRGIEFNLVTYNTLISLSADYGQALKYFNDIKARSIQPTINTFITLLKKARNRSDINEVERLLKNESIRTNNSWDRQLAAKRLDR